MYSPWIITIIVLGVAAFLIALFWIITGSSSNNASSQFGADLTTMREMMVNDSYLHRLLMIETIYDKTEAQEGTTGTSLQSETVTFDKMENGMNSFGKTLIRYFGMTIAQHIVVLMNKRNEVLRDYYRTLRTMTCNDGECIVNNDKESRPVFPPAFLSTKNIANDVLDITTLTERKLEVITREITDQVTSAFQLRDVDQTGRNLPLIHFQRLFNLITMYDRELVNQAKSYAFHHYDISMNCAQSSHEISNHISDEFAILMRENVDRKKILV